MYDAIVLAGGAARRLGGIAKPQLEIGGRTLLDRAVAAVSGAARVVVVGPTRPVAAEVVWCRENPPGSGPAAAIAAGVSWTAAEVVVVLAADLPWVAPAVPRLLAAVRASDAAFLADPGGRVNYLAGAWRRVALVSALEALGDPRDAAVRSLVAGTSPALVADHHGWGQDCDTWDDVAAARSHELDLTNGDADG